MADLALAPANSAPGRVAHTSRDYFKLKITWCPVLQVLHQWEASGDDAFVTVTLDGYLCRVGGVAQLAITVSRNTVEFKDFIHIYWRHSIHEHSGAAYGGAGRRLCCPHSHNKLELFCR